MASTMFIRVRYFGTSKAFVAGSETYVEAPIDENGRLSFDVVELRKKICSTCYLPPGSDITLVYIDKDGDVVTRVDDDDLEDALRQRLKSFRVDVLMNEDKVHRKSSSKRSTELMMDSDGSSLGNSDNSMEINKASTSTSAVHDDDDDDDDTSTHPTVACSRRSYSEAIGALATMLMLLHSSSASDSASSEMWFRTLKNLEHRCESSPSIQWRFLCS